MVEPSPILSFAGADELAAAAAAAWLDEIEAANRAGRGFCVALSGGRIAQNLFTATAAQAATRNTSFANVHFFWADERCVPPSDPESNFKLADECLFRPLRIVTQNIHRLRGEENPAAAAQEAEAELDRIALKNASGQPLLDLIILGMGEDGHIASLFPGATAEIVDISVSFLVVKNSPKPPPIRISLSYNMIIAAKTVWVLISGAGKAAALRESLAPEGRTPLAKIIHRRPVKIFSAINKF
jgi:6-phosphogluconolactonase